LPHDPEDYVHRIGRTGRAGATGTSVSFADEKDAFYIPAIEEFIDRKLNCTEPEEKWLIMPKPTYRKKRSSPRRRKRFPQSTKKQPPKRRSTPRISRNAA
jgi:ATP-dependent RNA helicase RhlB